jgi:integrase
VLPATVESICDFLEFHAGLGKRFGTLRRYKSSLATLHEFAGFTGTANPARAQEVKLCLKALARKVGTRPVQAAPLNWPLALRLIDVAGRSLIGLRDAALVATAYDTLARRSELASLQAEDLVISTDGTGAITIRRSKTDQEGQGLARFLSTETVTRLQNWMAAAEITNGSIFRAVRTNSSLGNGIDGGEVARILKKLAARAQAKAQRFGENLPVKGISGHSPRVGAAQDLMAAGCSLPEIMNAGGWKSPSMPGRYTENMALRRGAMAKLATMQGRI